MNIPCNAHELMLILFLKLIQAVLNVFDMASSDLHVYAMHLAIVHMHDSELVDKESLYLFSVPLFIYSTNSIVFSCSDNRLCATCVGHGQKWCPQC